jgi:hypothetical protein
LREDLQNYQHDYRFQQQKISDLRSFVESRSVSVEGWWKSGFLPGLEMRQDSIGELCKLLLLLVRSRELLLLLLV